MAQRAHIMDYVRDLIAHTDWLLEGVRLDALRNQEDPNSLVETLFDLGNYHDGKLLTFSFVLLNRVFSAVQNLVDLAARAKIQIVPTAIQLTEKVNAYMPILLRMAKGVIEEDEIEFVHFKCL